MENNHITITYRGIRPRLMTLFFLLALLAAIAPAAHGESQRWSPEVNALLDTLDTMLGESGKLNAAKTARINSLRQNYLNATDLEQRYWIARDLYEENSGFDSDSAMHYADICRSIAGTLGKQSWMDEMNLNRSYIFSATGLLDRSQNVLDSIDTSRLSERMLIRYYERVLFLQTHRDQYLGQNNADRPYPPALNNLIDSLCNVLPPTDPQYSWFVGWRALNNPEHTSQAIPLLMKEMEGSRFDSRDDAMKAWLLSSLYERTGDEENKMRYLILSAIADVRSSNKEIASIEEISGILFSSGDLQRANTYITYSINCANDYKSRVRVGALARYQELVLKAINQEDQTRMDAANRNNIVLVVFLAVQLLAIAYIYMQMRQLKRSRIALKEAKSRLEERVTELQQTRTELKEANSQLALMYAASQENAKGLSANNEAKEKYIANILTLCSNYINKLDDFRKNIYRKLMAKQFDELLEMVKSPDLSHGEIKELYANFDSIFLQIYPDFVNDFNTLLRPEERIVQKRGELLTTELRIYALVRLGLNDSVKIAKFLHCSVQTVYNVRQRARNKSDIPKDRFAEAVRSLGKLSI